MPRTKSPPAQPATSPRAERPAAYPSLAELRARLDLTQPEFARLLGFSTRWVAAHEADAESISSANARRRIAELARLLDALTATLRSQPLRKWLITPNPALRGLKPFEVIERGEIDRLWRIAFHLESGAGA